MQIAVMLNGCCHMLNVFGYWLSTSYKTILLQSIIMVGLAIFFCLMAVLIDIDMLNEAESFVGRQISSSVTPSQAFIKFFQILFGKENEGVE